MREVAKEKFYYVGSNPTLATKKNDMKTGFTSLLALIFIALKLVGTIDWGWVWVLSPIWIVILINLIGIIVSVFFVTKKR